MKKPLRLAHASDIHLDTDYHGGETNRASRDLCRRVFRETLDRIVAEHPALMLLPGDLFDSNRPSAETVQWCMEALAGLPFPVAIIPGNHDCLAPEGIFRRHDFSALPNVEMLTDPEGETRVLEPLQVFLWGKGMVDHAPEFRPLEGMPAPTPDCWNLALGHGIFVGRGANRFRSSPIETRQIEASGYDYIALGHHHALLDVSGNGTAAWYCGAPTPISDDAKGTFVTVELAEGRPAQVAVHTLD